MTEAATFGEWLKKRRKALDLTQEQLADRAGCSVWLIQKIEEGTRRASRQTAEILVACLQVEQDERPVLVEWARTGRAPYPGALGPGTQVAPQDSTSDRAPAAGAVDGSAGLPGVPVPLSPLIGREESLTSLHGLLRRNQLRLITLVGPPGIGKTRLALELASQPDAGFESGVVFVSLAPVLDPTLVSAAIAQAAGLKNAGSQPLRAFIIDFLRGRRLLMVLDNFEHLLGATPLVAELLSAAPGLKVIVTSREALNIRGEQQFDVPPLELPDPAAITDLDSVARSPAVALFVDRAQSVAPGFELTEENAADVAAICARLDGIPLAIELAATRSKLFSPHEILARLQNRLTALTVGPRDLPPRHQTLRNAIAWSHDLLTPPEQLLFARMAAFVGGCTLSAIEAVCNPEGDLGADVQCLLESLLNKSLLRSERVHEETRLSMLETIREYALEKVQELGELDMLRRYHLEYYLVLAEAVDHRLPPADLAAWFDRLEREHDNTRVALRWAIDSGNADAALRLSGALWVFWGERGYWNEGREWLEEATRLEGAEQAPGFARSILGLGWIISYQGEDQAPAEACMRKSLEAYSRADDRHGVAEALTQLAWIAAYRGDADEAADLARDSLALYEQFGDKYGMTVALNIIAGQALERRDYQEARKLFTQSYELACKINHPGRKASSLNALGETARYEGRYDDAEAFYIQSLELSRESGNRVGVAHSLHNLGQISLRLGDPRRGLSLFSESMLICRYLQDVQGLRENLAGMAGVMLDLGPRCSAQAAARLLAAVDASTEEIGPALAVADREQYDSYLCKGRAMLGCPEFEIAWQEGQAMSINEAVEYALKLQESE